MKKSREGSQRESGMSDPERRHATQALVAPMTRRRAQVGWALALAALMLVSSAAMSQPSPQDGYYRYRSEVTELDVEVTAIAVRDTEDLITDTGVLVVPEVANATGTVLDRAWVANGWNVFTEGPLRAVVSRDNASSPPGIDRAAGFDLVRDVVRSLSSQLQSRWGSRFVVSPLYRTIESGDLLLLGRRLTVKFDDDVSASVAETVVNDVVDGTIVAFDFGGVPNMHLVELQGAVDGMESLSRSNQLHLHDDVTFSEPAKHWVSGFSPSACSTITSAPNDDLFDDQWGLATVNALDAWALCSGDPNVQIAVLDDGVERGHEDLSGNVIVGTNHTADHGGSPLVGTSSEGGPASECDNHGTFVAGIAVAKANNVDGIAGMAPNVEAVSRRAHYYYWDNVFNMGCRGEDRFNMAQTVETHVIAAIDAAVNGGASVTNHSWNWNSGMANIEEAYDDARSAGVVAVASTGNDDPSSQFPAKWDSVIGVGSVDEDGRPSSFSNYGEGGVFISAPGRDIVSTDRSGDDGYDDPGDYYTWEGTSFSAPIVAGVIALMRSLDPSLQPADVEVILASTATDVVDLPGQDDPYLEVGWDERTGWGIVNADAALDLVSAWGPIFEDAFDAGLALSLWAEVVP